MSDDNGLYFGPCLNPGAAEPWTDEQLAATFSRHPHLLTPLPYRVRLRLAIEQAVTNAGIWLCDHRMHRAAGLLWWRR